MFASTALTIDAVTYGGVALTPGVAGVHTYGGTLTLRSQIWYITTPASGSNTVSITLSGTATSLGVIAVTYSGAGGIGPNTNTAGGNITAVSMGLTTSAATSLILGMFANAADRGVTPGTVTTLATITNDGSAPPNNIRIYTGVLAATGGADTWSATQSTASRTAGAALELTERTGQPPGNITIDLDTADGGTLGTTPTLAFTGTDAQADDIRYQVQISDNPNFPAAGVALRDSDGLSATSGGFHENGMNALTWQGNYQVDDRFGHTFVAYGGAIDHVRTWIDTREAIGLGGTAVARIYAIQGTPGTDAAPLNAAAAANTPTPGWLAESDAMTLSTSINEEREFAFSGANRIHLTPGGEQAFSDAWQVESHGRHHKMALTAPQALSEIDASRVSHLTASDLPALQDLYQSAYPGNWFDPRMLETGCYYGVCQGERILSVAGGHVFSPRYRVAAIGNITTHPDFRGQGLGTQVTAQLCRQLTQQVDHIGLHVRTDNAVAIACYQRLGFTVVADYEEFMFLPLSNE